jgi:hypothetical protein
MEGPYLHLMPSTSPLASKQFVAVSTMLATTVLTILIILAPIDEWWAILFPRELAVYRLQNAPPGVDFGGCPFGPAERWQIIRRDADAGLLFDSVVSHAESPAAILFGLAGLREVGSARYAILRDSILSGRIDSIYVWKGEMSAGYVRLDSMLGGPLFDSTIALLKRPMPTFEC